MRNKDTPRPTATYEDLPAIVDVVQSSLPNLAKLHIALLDVHRAEAACRAALDDRVLRESGSITSLRIFTPPFTARAVAPHVPVPTIAIAMFNTVRLVSRICTKNANISLAWSHDYGNKGQEQVGYLQALWR